MTAPVAPSATTGAIAMATTLLFVPATRPERIAKALASGASAVIVDLEDAVGLADKLVARHGLAQALAGIPEAQRARLLVRINAEATPWHFDDLIVAGQLVRQGLAGVMVPKAESAATLEHAASVLGSKACLVPLIESVAGLDAATSLARAPQVARLAFGHLDFQIDAGMDCTGDEPELQPVRTAIVLASRRAQVAPPVDGVTTATVDIDRMLADAWRARRGGFGGKLCIHPAQVGPVRTVFEPSQQDIDWAQRVLAGAEANNGGVFSLDGRMVDAPVIRSARRILSMPA